MKSAYRLILSVVACVAFSTVRAQQIVPSLEWERLYYESACNVTAVVETDDGGYILGGSLEDDCILVKIGGQGELRWEKTYGGSGNEIMRSLRLTTDGGYVFVATSDSPRSGNKQSTHFGMEDVWVVKVDATGNKQWERSIGGNGSDSAISIWPAAEGEYLIAGTSPGPFTVPSHWVIKINAQGELGSPVYLGDKVPHFLVSLMQTADGGYALAGASFPLSGTHFGGQDGWLMKVDADGNKQWEHFFGGTDDEIFLSIDQSADGGFILGGRSDSPPSGNKESRHFGGFYDYWLVKVDAAGNKQWDRSYGTSTPSVEEVRVVRQTTDQGYIFGGYVGGNSRLVKVDAQGRQQWDQPLGNPDDHNTYIVEINDLQQTKDGGYVLGGRFDLPNAGIPAFGCTFGSWVAKLENVVSRSGEVVTWNSDPGVLLESVDDLNSEWKANTNEVFSVGPANAIPLVPIGQQRYYRSRKPVTSSDTPSLGLGALLTWPAAGNQMLEFSSSKNGPWNTFSGDQGTNGNTRGAIIPQNLKQHYFRTRTTD